jgi:hypothetical protein
MYFFDSNNVHGEINASLDIFHFQIRIVIADDGGERYAFTNEFEHSVDWNSSTHDTGFAEVDARVDGDSSVHKSSIGLYPILLGLIKKDQ